MGKRIFLDIETLPPVESFRENLAREIYAEQGPGELGPGEAEIDVEVERRFRDLALRGEWGRLLCVGLVVEEGGVVKHCGALGRDRQTRQFHLDEAAPALTSYEVPMVEIASTRAAPPVLAAV
jgi:hypothetical protein